MTLRTIRYSYCGAYPCRGNGFARLSALRALWVRWTGRKPACHICRERWTLTVAATFAAGIMLGSIIGPALLHVDAMESEGGGADADALQRGILAKTQDNLPNAADARGPDTAPVGDPTFITLATRDGGPAEMPVEQAKTGGENRPLSQASAITTVPSVQIGGAPATGHGSAMEPAGEFVPENRGGSDEAVRPPPAPNKPATTLRWAHITGYCQCAICCPGTDDGITSTGVDVSRHPWGVAAARSMLDRGTMVRIQNYHGGRWVRVDDDGGRMRRDARRGILHVDVRCATHGQAQGINYWGWVEVQEP